MKLSIIIPVYNVEKHIVNCLESVLNQDISKSEYEIIVINDGSTDNSYTLAQKYADRYKNIILLSQKNRGISVTRNNGLKIAKGKYVYFIDSDDSIAPNVLKSIIHNLETHNLEILSFNLLKINGLSDIENLEKGNIQPELSKVTDGITYLAQRGFNASVCWFFIKRSFLNDLKIKFVEGRMLEDILFNAIIFTKAKKIAHLPLNVYYYLIHQESIMRNTSAKHYKKLINDYEFVLIELNLIINNLHYDDQNIKSKCIKGMKNLQGVFLNFLFIRIMRSNSSIKYINGVIQRLKSVDLYPIRPFSKSIKNKMMLVVINNKILFYPLIMIYRLLSKRKMKKE